MSSKITQGVIQELEQILEPQGRVLTDPADLLCYAFDASGIDTPPGVVVMPVTTRQVAAVARLASRYQIPLFARGAGSGTAGGSVPVSHGIAVVLTAMNRILEINAGNLTARVEPGVITGRLQEEVSRHGLFYPPDPASLSFCTIGGNVSTGAGGARAVKYGVTRDYVTSLEVVLASGQVVETGHDTAKGVAGYDLTRLLVGSEGTLGIITGITLRLVPLPQATGTALVLFTNASAACRGVKSFFQNRLLPRCAEFFDAACIQCVRHMLPVPVPDECQAMLLVEVDGSEESIGPQLEVITECCSQCGALETVVAADAEQAETMWKARRSLSPAIRRLGYSGKVSEDICVPRHRLPEAVERLDHIAEKFSTRIISFGHAGDGNLHVNLLFDRQDRIAVKNMEMAVSAIMEAAVSLGGTISGEHGIGLAKKGYMELDAGPAALDLMKGIKQVFDPHGIMNPGKIFP